jgi:hypothetical protein
MAVKAVVPGARLVEAAPDFVGLTDVAQVLGLSRQNLHKLMNKYRQLSARAKAAPPSALADVLACCMPGQLPAGTRPDRRGPGGAANQPGAGSGADAAAARRHERPARLMGRELRENYVFILISHRKHGQNVVGPAFIPI